MYFNDLETLKDSDVPPAQVVLLDEFLAANWGHADRVFGATLLARTAELDFDTAVELLMHAARAHVVRLRYQLGCSECGATNEIVENPTDVGTEPLDCRQCFATFVPDLNDVWIAVKLL